MEEKEIKETKPKKNKKQDELLEKVKVLEEEVLRAKADLINYRKRKDEEVSNLLKYANVDIIMNLLSVVDNFERVINIETKEEFKSYMEGFELIYNQIKEILKANEVIEIEALGKEFDPNLHQSISMVEDKEKPSNTVIEVYQKGYTYKDKVLRPSMVIINK